MRKITWIPLVILIVGVCLAGTGWAMGGHKINNVGVYWQNGLHISGVDSSGKIGKLVKLDESYKANDVQAIELDVDYLDYVTIKAGEAGSDIKVVGVNYEEYGGLKSNLTGNKLFVSSKAHRDDRHFVFNFGLFPDSEKCYLEITVPEDLILENLEAKIDASSITIRDLECVTSVIDNDYGDIELTEIKSGDMKIKANAGKIDASTITVARLLEIDNDFGNIKLSSIDAGDISIEADAGRIEMNTVTSKGYLQVDNNFGDVRAKDIQASDMNVDLDAGQMIFERVITNTAKIESNYGDINFDRITLNGFCEVKNDSGNVTFGLTNDESEVGYELKADVGSISVGGRSNTSIDNVSQNVINGTTQIDIKNNFGSITLEFGR